MVAHLPLDPETFAQKLIELGERHALDQAERAEKVGISLRHYKRLEAAGVVNVRFKTVRKVAEGYGIDPADFLSEVADESGRLGDRLERIETAIASLDALVRVELLPVLAALEAEEQQDAAERSTAQTQAAKQSRRAAS